MVGWGGVGGFVTGGRSEGRSTGMRGVVGGCVEGERWGKYQLEAPNATESRNSRLKEVKSSVD